MQEVFHLLVHAGCVRERWYTVDREHAALVRPLAIRIPSTMPLDMKAKLLQKERIVKLKLQGHHNHATVVPDSVVRLSLVNMFRGSLQFTGGSQLHTVYLDSAVNYPMHQVIAALPQQLHALHISGGSTCTRPLSILQYIVNYPVGLKKLSLQNVQDVQAPLPERLETFSCTGTRSAQLPTLPATLRELYLKMVTSEGGVVVLPPTLEKLVVLDCSCSVLGFPPLLIHCEVSGRNAPQVLQQLPESLRVLKLSQLRTRFNPDLPQNLEVTELPAAWWRR